MNAPPELVRSFVSMWLDGAAAEVAIRNIETFERIRPEGGSAECTEWCWRELVEHSAKRMNVSPRSGD